MTRSFATLLAALAFAMASPGSRAQTDTPLPLAVATDVSFRVAPDRRTHEFLPNGEQGPASTTALALVTPRAPKRIVSLAPVVTEIVFAAGASDRLVGVTTYCDRPLAAKKIPKVGGFTSISLESVLALRPDLVIAMPSLGQRQVLERLRDHGVEVVVGFGDTIGEVRSLISGVTTAVAASPVSATKQAAAQVARFDASLAAVVVRRPHPPKTVVAVSSAPLVVAGGATFASEALLLVGAVPVLPANSPAWPVWSSEALLQANVDVVVAAGGAQDAEVLRALVSKNPHSKTTVVAANGSILMRPGIHLAEDLAVLARLLDATPNGARASAVAGPRQRDVESAQ